MGLLEASETYKSLLSTIANFKSPVFKSYFTSKANDDYKNLLGEIDNGKFKCAIKKYMDDQKNLDAVLKRQTKIYNMYYDETSNI